MEIDLDVSKLDVTAAERLRSLFEQTAAGARGRGWEAEETFLIGLAGMMTSYCEAISGKATTEPEDPGPAPEDLEQPGPLVFGIRLSGRHPKALRIVAAALQRSANTTFEAYSEDPATAAWLPDTVDLMQGLAKVVASAALMPGPGSD